MKRSTTKLGCLTVATLASLTIGWLSGCRTETSAAVHDIGRSNMKQHDASSNEAARLADKYWQEQLRRGPERATYLGDHRYDDRLADYSMDAIRRARQWDSAFYNELKRVDVADLPPDERLNLELLKETIEQSISLADFPEHLMPVKQQDSPHLTLGTLHSYHPFNTPQDCANYAARLRAVNAQVDQLIALMNEGITRKIVRPKITIEQALPQIASLIADDPRQSPLYKPATTLSSAAGGDKSRAEIEDGVRTATAALKRLQDYLKDTYLPACRDTVGYVHLTDGKQWYRALAAHHTTTALTPEQIHEIGLAELKRIHEEMRKVMAEVGFTGTLQQFIEKMRRDPAQHNRTSEEIMRRHREILARSDANLPKLFGRLPKIPYELKEMESFRAAGAPEAYYYNAPDDGSRPAYFYVNTFDPTTRPIYTMEALAYHEAQPGHHLQIALAQERADWPAFRRFDHINAYIEGWALYSERLGYDLGGYRDPYSRFGQLTYDTWRSSRLVVDTGMHWFGWTRQRAIDFMKENTGLSEQNIVSEVDRYIAWPGQALAYKIGQLEILKLRAEAETALGSKFDVRAFHDEILAEGSIPLAMLSQRIHTWIENHKQ